MSNMKRYDAGLKRLLLPAMQGILAFAIASALASVMILLYDNYFAAAILTGGLGTLLLSILMHKYGLSLWKMPLSGLIGLPVGLIFSFMVVEGIGSLVPAVGRLFENTPVPDIVAVMMMSAIYGMFVGGLNFGKKAVWKFAAVCGVSSVPAGVLIAVFNAGGAKALVDLFGKVDLNFVTIMLFVGLGIGTSIGALSGASRVASMGGVWGKK